MTLDSSTPRTDGSFVMPPVEALQLPGRRFDLRAFGARDGNQFNNTESFHQAIDSCAQAGGGTIVVPAGVWLTGPIHLQSKVCLHLDAGATVRFSTRPSDYLPVVFTRWEGVECYNYSPLIYANGCHDVALTGCGVFEGDGQAWWHWKKLQHPAAKLLYHAQKNRTPVNQRIFGTEQDALRPPFVQFIHCRRVLIEGVTFRNGPMWTLHPVYCDHVQVRHVRVITDPDSPNTDGLNPDSCNHVLVEHSTFSTGDDCIAINSGMNEDGWRVNRPCRHIHIRHCRMQRGHGAVVIGSGMSGGVQYVHAHDCQCIGTDRGIRLKSMLGRGGVVENVLFENFVMKDITHEAVTIDMHYGAASAPSASNEPPTFRNIHIRNVQCEGANRALHLRGLPQQPLTGLKFENINLRAKHGQVCEEVTDLSMKKVNICTVT